MGRRGRAVCKAIQGPWRRRLEYISSEAGRCGYNECVVGIDRMRLRSLWRAWMGRGDWAVFVVGFGSGREVGGAGEKVDGSWEKVWWYCFD